MALGLVVVVFGTNLARAAEAAVGLGTATNFAVLSGSGVTNTGPTIVTGDLGVSPATAVTGFPPGVIITGTTHANDAVAAQAQSDLTIAYNDAAGRSTTAVVTADLAGQTLVGGVYTGATLALNGTVTLDAQGDPTTVFVFQSAATLVTGTSSRVALIGGADPCNVYWQVGSSATLGTTTTFAGSILALTSITLNTGAAVQGRLLARNGAVTLDSNLITRPTCAAITPTTTTTSASSSSTTLSSTTTAPGSTTTTALQAATTTAFTAPTTTSASSSTTVSDTTSSPSSTTAGSSTTGVSTTVASILSGGDATTTTTGRATTLTRSGGDTGSLPATGADPRLLTLAGALVVTFGAVMTLASRTALRRATTTPGVDPQITPPTRRS